MTRELYTALRSRISVMPDIWYLTEFEDARLPEGAIVYFFNADGLGEDVYSMVHCMKTKNLWNVAQRLYSHLRSQFESDDAMNQALLNN